MKNMTKKRLFAGAMAGAMALSMSTAALAADDGNEDEGASNETVITATYAEAEIAVTIPGEVSGFINPYALDIALENDSESSLKGFQIGSLPAALVNLSDMDLAVSATVTGKILDREDESTTNAMKFSATKITGAETPVTSKSAYVVFQMSSANSLTTSSGALADDDLAVAQAAWAASEDLAKSQVVVSTKAATGTDLCKLKKAADSEAVAGGIALIRLNGECVESPKIAWDEQDGFEVTIAYTFKPTTIGS